MKYVGLLLLLLTFSGCQNEPQVPKDEEELVLSCDTLPLKAIGAILPMASFSLPYSTYEGNLDSFSKHCKNDDEYPISLISSNRQTHQIIVSFDAVYPVSNFLIHLDEIVELSIYVTLDDEKFTPLKNTTNKQESIDLDIYAKGLKIAFSAQNEMILSHLTFYLGDGYWISQETPWNDVFLRYSNWTGADGIFSFNLTGEDVIGSSSMRTAFVFSDTFIGNVAPETFIRSSFTLINNTIGYYDPNKVFEEAFSFEVSEGPISTFLPDTYLYQRPEQLFSNEGMNPSLSIEGKVQLETTSYWVTDNYLEPLFMTFKSPKFVEKLMIWNAIEPHIQVNSMRLSAKLNGEEVFGETYTLQSLPVDGSLSDSLEINVLLDELVLTVLSSASETHASLSKIRIYGEEQFLFPEVNGNFEMRELADSDQHSRLWLQDGVVIDDHIYLFPLLIKNDGSFFKVDQVGLIKTPIDPVSLELKIEDTTYFHTPLQVRTEDFGQIFYGAGVLDQSQVDGYIYIYGYKDLSGRHLVVARVLKENFEDMNAWSFYNGESFVKDIRESAPLITGVSAELSVSYVPNTSFGKDYVLTSMKYTTSGTISISTSDTPYGPFDSWTDIFEVPEPNILPGSFTYNAKMHPHLSTPSEILISYNVNAINFVSHRDARYYYPRMIILRKIEEES